MAIPLEDNVSDIVGKAQRGLGISDTQLAQRARVSSTEIRKIRAGHLNDMVLWRIAPVLGLGARALVDLGRGDWLPEIRQINGLAMFNTEYDDMAVNSFLVWDPKSRDAVAFDTGADCRAMLRKIEQAKLQVRMILLTHAHPDHVADLKKLHESTGAPIFISERENAPGAQPITEGEAFDLGGLNIDAMLTWGHSQGGMTYFVTGLTSPVAVVGDSIFAGSMGGGSVSYSDAVRNNLEKVLTLPDETVICPGHGPLTTVGEEKSHNPFFAMKFHE